MSQSSRRSFRSRALLGAALACALTGEAFAQGDREAALEERMRALEEALAAVRAELQAARAEMEEMAATEEEMDDLLIRLERSEAAAVAAGERRVDPAEGFMVGGANIRIGGFVKAEALVSDYSDGDIAGNSVARDFFVPGATPVGGNGEDPDFDAHARQSRLTLTIDRPIEGHKLGAYVEVDFQSAPSGGTERITNAHNLGLRRAYVTFDNWLFGQDWTTFQNVAVLPETPDFIGPSDGTVFARQPMVRYTRKLSEQTSLQLALENPETTVFTPASAVFEDVDDDPIPDVIARLNTKVGKADFALAGMVRQLNVDNFTTAGTTFSDSALGWGVSLSGKIPVGARDDIRFMATGGQGIGRYLAVAFAPDALASGGADPGLEPIAVYNGFLAYRHFWTPNVRSSLVASYIGVEHEDGTPGAASETSYSGAVNLFWTPVPRFDLGVEYRHAQREILSGADGSLDRIHFVAKHSF